MGGRGDSFSDSTGLNRPAADSRISRRHRACVVRSMLEPHRRRIDALETRFVTSTRRLIESADGRLAARRHRLRSVSQARGSNRQAGPRGSRGSSRFVVSSVARPGRERLDSLGDQLRIVGRESVLAQGYSLVVDGEGRVVGMPRTSNRAMRRGVPARTCPGTGRSIEVDEVESSHD